MTCPPHDWQAVQTTRVVQWQGRGEPPTGGHFIDKPQNEGGGLVIPVIDTEYICSNCGKVAQR